MAKGDATGGIGIGYNPGGPNIGGSASFGSRPQPPAMMGSQLGQLPPGFDAAAKQLKDAGIGGVGPSTQQAQNMMGSQTNTVQNQPGSIQSQSLPQYPGRGGMMPSMTYDQMMQQFQRAGGYNNPRLPQNNGPMTYRPVPFTPVGYNGPGSQNYRPQPMPYRSAGPMIGPSPDMGTSTVPPISPNSYSLNPSANPLSKRQ
jgi:hypothetical protein